MIFQHTLDKVLSGEKTQTSRIWKHYYRIGEAHNPYSQYERLIGYGSFHVLWSANTDVPRIVYAIDRKYSVQPGRGKKGQGFIRITSLAKREIRDFDEQDMIREGFSFDDFFMLWCQMHDRNYDAVVINFELL